MSAPALEERGAGAREAGRALRVAVCGLWHLGAVTAAVLAEAGHRVLGWDPDAERIAALREGRAPLLEAGLDALLAAGLARERLSFGADAEAAVRGADVVWLTFDTPVDGADRADAQSVLAEAERLFPWLEPHALVLVSSQLPVGSVAALERAYRARYSAPVSFGCIPENLRLGSALRCMREPDRVVVGLRGEGARARVRALLPFAERIVWMSVESAEMTKHAINAFLATSVAFANEIAVLCEHSGADAREVEQGLRSESRIGMRAYVGPGGPFAGGTLGRDLGFLGALAERAGERAGLLGAVRESNEHHKTWVQRKLRSCLGALRGRRVGVWGLTYKAGTSTLRRSAALELCGWLAAQGVAVRAFDPAVSELPGELAGEVVLAASPLAAVEQADAVVVATDWPEFRAAEPASLRERMRTPLVVDGGRVLFERFAAEPGLIYQTLGRGARA